MNPAPKRGRGWLRLLAFFLIPMLFIYAANRLLLCPDAHSYFTLTDLTHRQDIELALVGSSVVGYNIDPDIITEKTGLSTFDASIGMMGLPSSVAVTRLLLEHNSPKYVALMLDASSLISPEESIQAQMRISPFIKNPLERLAYALDLAVQDGQYLDRLLLFKSMPVESLEDIRRIIELHTDPRGYYARRDMGNGTTSYKGRGHVQVNLTPRRGKLLSTSSLRPYRASDHTGLYAYSKQKIREFVRLCKESGARPLVIIPPDLTAHRIAEIGYMDKSIALAEFCREEGIDFFDFSIARPEFLPRLDDYFYDLYHLNREGARLFSERFAEFLNLYTNSKPVDHLFYESQTAYLEDIDFITNVWFDTGMQDGTLTLSAACNCGPNVTPEYCFLYEAPDGTQTVLRDYNEDSAFCIRRDALAHEGKLLVWARPKDDPHQEPVFYERYLPKKESLR